MFNSSEMSVQVWFLLCHLIRPSHTNTHGPNYVEEWAYGFRMLAHFIANKDISTSLPARFAEVSHAMMRSLSRCQFRESLYLKLPVNEWKFWILLIVLLFIFGKVFRNRLSIALCKHVLLEACCTVPASALHFIPFWETVTDNNNSRRESMFKLRRIFPPNLDVNQNQAAEIAFIWIYVPWTYRRGLKSLSWKIICYLSSLKQQKSNCAWKWVMFFSILAINFKVTSRWCSLFAVYTVSASNSESNGDGISCCGNNQTTYARKPAQK